ncbi:cis-prenyltransferase, dehydrodolichyl diphosphate synthase [Babesia microti strain RI]|uniref:Alkyl transferase n=1 Tax=Babesia microti (strain RI) TaxID=1133968 RepID=A0A1N6LWQ4_BABMR|nr:cis-prenyltransferase, dehydrodolichyl diphosphate synthase [Babesia microti strain RI]SIO73305.1 cis-prenyltransferase, dehydrodolichyl diphosphate synthase [Babesia microti strain RI]|eukprot:XP_021337407.1 cis-prenyltransferase, dehydrodolichyl diphosphate synthase [Babesia microti strain RI]
MWLCHNMVKLLRQILFKVVGKLFCVKHLAIIMDGNRRWARIMNLPLKEGWSHGIWKLYEIIEVASELGIENVSVFAFSMLNFQRVESELNELDEISIRTLTKPDQIMRLARQYNIRIFACGDTKYLPKKVRNAVRMIEKETCKNSKMILNLCVSYGGRNEIKRSLKRVGKTTSKNKLNDIALKRLFWKNLYTGHSPRPDILIRTSGENRISDFMIYQVSEFTSIYFHQMLWPEFRISSLIAILVHYTVFKV